MYLFRIYLFFLCACLRAGFFDSSRAGSNLIYLLMTKHIVALYKSSSNKLMILTDLLSDIILMTFLVALALHSSLRGLRLLYLTTFIIFDTYDVIIKIGASSLTTSLIVSSVFTLCCRHCRLHYICHS
jgi:hypothetical protein